jgi:uncharacterized repeat protein (TIGR01451 family)
VKLNQGALVTTLLFARLCSAGALASSTAPTTIGVSSEADLSVTKSDSPDPVILSASPNLTYSLTVTNHGPADATSVLLEDTLPSTVTAITASGGCAYNSDSHTILCFLGTIADGDSRLLQIDVMANAVGLITNSVEVLGFQTDPNPSNNSDSQMTTVSDPELIFGDGFELGHLSRWSVSFP